MAHLRFYIIAPILLYGNMKLLAEGGGLGFRVEGLGFRV